MASIKIEWRTYKQFQTELWFLKDQIVLGTPTL